MDQSVALFGPLDTILEPYIAVVMLGLIVVNMATRTLEYDRQVEQVRDGGAEALERYPFRIATNFLLVVGAFYYLSVEPHAGLIVSVLVVAVVLADLFEFEARVVEARQEWDLDRPKAAIAASAVAFLYITYQALFFVVRPYWEVIV